MVERTPVMWKTTLAIATAATALIGSADAATFNVNISPRLMSSIRIEPPRPGDLYGRPRGSNVASDLADEATVGKPPPAPRRRSR
jgi:hypothetical protein